MSTHHPVNPQTPKRLIPLVAVSILLLVASAGLILMSRGATQAPEAPSTQHEESAEFVPAMVEDTPPQDTEETKENQEVAQQEQPQEDLPTLHDEEALTDEAVELGYKIEEMQQGAGGKKDKRKTLKPANLIVVANFDVTDVTVNGLPYPEYFEDKDEQGMVLPAGGPYDVKIVYSGKVKSHTLSFKPYETRYLVAEIPGYAGVSAPPSTPPPAKPQAAAKAEEKKEEAQEEKNEEAGRITVYAKPRGDILLDGKEAGQRTPNTIESPDGRHEVQVRYEDGEVSEKKVVRVRKGSRIKLFFRQKKK